MQTSERNGPAGAPAEDGFAAEHISQRYGRKTVLHDCTVRAGRGECVGVAGRNGCGKSTLLSVLAGISRPVSGSVTCFGRNLLAGRKAFAELVGYVPQTNPLLEDLSVWDNLRLLSGRNIPKDDRFLKALELTDLLGTKVSALSGGMKRRAAIACSLAVSPPVLVMDEPTSALDLYHKSVMQGNKVNNVITYNMLSAELSIEVFTSKHLPHSRLCLCGIIPHLFCLFLNRP